MTIKELETRTGMTRANIRFYENEGLLTPKRLENGYRDYSEEDARTLEKIKLLRQLQLDIDTIRRVQQGTLTLEQALFVQTTKLEGDRAVIERAAAVCRELERSGVEYASLEPQPWLAQLQAPQRAQLSQPSAAPEGEAERDREPRACYCPWQRLFARGLDMALYDTVLNVLWLVILRDQSLLRLQSGNILASWFCGAVLLALTLALEPFWLHFWGWTPGKWIFGLKIRDAEGDKLTLAQARARCRQLAWEGYGFNLPIFRLWRMWQGRVTGLEGRDCHWDCENGYRYTKEERSCYALVYIAVRGVCVGALSLAMMFSTLPVCRGDLTVAEFSRNYDHFLRLLYPGGEYGHLPTLDEEGRWTARSGSGVPVHTSGGITVTAGGSVQIIEDYVETTVWDEPAFTVEDGRVTAVTLHMESTESSLWPNEARQTLTLLAMTGALDEVSLFHFDIYEWGRLTDVLLAPWEDAELDYRGVHIRQQVAYSGYYAVTDTLLRENQDTPCRCEKTVTISLAQ